MITLLGWCLFPIGLAGTIMVGRKIRKGWLLSLAAQAMWLLYAWGTRQWNLMPGTLAYTAVYVDSYLAWGKEGHAAGVEALAVRLWRKTHPKREDAMPEPEPQHDRSSDAGGSGTDRNEHADWGRSDGGEDS